MNFRKRFLFLPLLLLLFAVMLISVYRDVRQQTIADFNRQQKLLARQTAKSIEALFHRYYNDLTYLSSIDYILKMDFEGKLLLQAYLASNPDLRAVTRVDSTGKILFTLPAYPGAVGVDISEQDHMRMILRTHLPVVSDVFMAVQNYRAVAYHVPLIRDGVFHGTLAVLIPFDRIVSEFLENIHLEYGRHAWVISRKGVELYSSVPENVGRSAFKNAKNNDSKLALIQQMVSGHEGATVYYPSAEQDSFLNKRMLAVYYPVNLSNTFWSICVAAPEDEVLAAITGFRNKLILVFSLLFALGILYTYFFLRAELVLREERRRKKAEAALRESEKRFRELADLLPQSVFETDIHGKLTFANLKAFETFGYSHQEFDKGLTIFQMLIPEEKERAIAEIKEVMAGRPVPEREYIALKKDGSTFPALIYSDRIVRDGEPVGLRGVLLDITERKQLEEQFKQAQKMEAVGQLAGGIAHDFNNLLTIIIGYCELLQQQKLTSTLQSSVAQIAKAGERAARLTSQLLAFSRKQIIQPRILNLNDEIESTRRMLQRLIGENIELLTEPASDLENIQADPGQVDQILVNLSVNARDAISGSGKIIISTQNIPDRKQGKSIHPLPAKKRFVRLSVSDSGHGMEPEIVEKIFEPFFTTKGAGKGSGLGLSTVYGIMKQNKGDIFVESKPGQGTTFHLYFPAAGHRIKSETIQQKKADFQLTPLNVLLVEDDDGVRTFLEGVLAAQNFRILVASNGKEALKLCRENHNRLDLMVTDVVMPGISGKELAEEIKEIHPHIRVLFCSGYPDEALARHGVLESETAFLQKPISAAGLLQKIQELFAN